MKVGSKERRQGDNYNSLITYSAHNYGVPRESVRVYLNVGRAGAPSYNREIRAAAPALSYWPRLRATGPACTAAAAVHAG